MPNFVTEQAKAYGLDLTTARIVNGVWRADVCHPLSGGHWEYGNKGWEHVPSRQRRSIGDIWASGEL